MTTVYEKVKVEVERSRFVSRVCDWCGAEMGEDYGEEGQFDVRDFELTFAVGSSYPGSGHKEGWQVEDLCDGCVERLRKLLEDSGVKVAPYEVDW